MNPQQKVFPLSTLIISIVVLALLAFLFVSYYTSTPESKIVIFTCKNSKSIGAVFYPQKDTNVELTLSDGRTLTLPHVISGSGARYANSDESIVFWNKGTSAFITEGTTTTYLDCETLPETGTSTQMTPPIKLEPPVTTLPAGYAGYANAAYGFSLGFPKTTQSSNGFSTFKNLPNNWRVYAETGNQGTSVASFVIFRKDEGGIATGKAYPLFYGAEVRVGVSPNVAKCYDTDPGFANQKVSTVTINGIPFKKFSASDAGMMKYTQVESYRTIHNKMCYVLEQIRTGSSYKDETMTNGLSQAILDSYFTTGEMIIKTFRFSK